MKMAGRRAATFMIMALAVFFLSCQKKEDKSQINLQLESNSFKLLDAPATSCKSRLDLAPKEDLTPLTMNFGRLKLSWQPPTDASRLRIVYLKIRLSSVGLTEGEKIITVAGDDLQCILINNKAVVGGDILSGSQKDFTFAADLRVGGLGAADSTLRDSFFGTGDMLIYGVVLDSGETDTAYTGRVSFSFSFPGIEF